MFFLKIPQTGGSPGIFFAREHENSVQGEVQKKETGVERSISEGGLTTSFGAGRGGSLKKKIDTSPNWREPWRFFAKQDKNMYQEEFQKKNRKGQEHLRGGQKNKFEAR